MRASENSYLLKQSEKGCEQRSERECGRYIEGKMDRKIPFRRPIGLRGRRVQTFQMVYLGIRVNNPFLEVLC